MSAPRICPECGSDIYRASHYDDLLDRKNLLEKETRKQALEILRLRMEVEVAKDWKQTRNRKVEQQRRTIRRLEDRLREAGLWPHEDKRLDACEGDPASHAPALSDPPGSEQPPDYPNPRGMRKMRRAAGEGDT